MTKDEKAAYDRSRYLANRDAALVRSKARRDARFADPDTRSKDRAYANSYRRKPKYRSYVKEYRKGAKSRARARLDGLKHRYRLSGESFNDMMSSQGAACAFCRAPFGDAATDRPCVDHCHDTGRVRRLLCLCCNFAYGAMKESPATIARALEASITDAESKVNK